jgi:hypothetical protein
MYNMSCQIHSIVFIAEEKNNAFIFKFHWTSKYLNFNRKCQSHPFTSILLPLMSDNIVLLYTSGWTELNGKPFFLFQTDQRERMIKRMNRIATLSFNSKTEQAGAESSYHEHYCQQKGKASTTVHSRGRRVNDWVLQENEKAKADILTCLYLIF